MEVPVRVFRGGLTVLHIAGVVWGELLLLAGGEHAVDCHTQRLHVHGRGPFAVEDVQAYVSIAVHMRVDRDGAGVLREEDHFWGFQRIVGGEAESQHVRVRKVDAALCAGDSDLPLVHGFAFHNRDAIPFPIL
eukprot:Nk52_evm18s250 gene=Nk52_evmTU18s250